MFLYSSIVVGLIEDAFFCLILVDGDVRVRL